MRMKLLAISFIAALTITNSANAFGGGCGYRPIKPMACLNGKFICLCDPKSGTVCEWLLMNC